MLWLLQWKTRSPSQRLNLVGCAHVYMYMYVYTSTLYMHTSISATVQVTDGRDGSAGPEDYETTAGAARSKYGSSENSSD